MADQETLIRHHKRYKELKHAIKSWIRADYNFRFGPHCYSAREQTMLVKAEEELREALTGKTDIVKAAEKIKTDVNWEKPPKSKRFTKQIEAAVRGE